MTIKVHPAAADAAMSAERASVNLCLFAPRAKREHL
jgi:hypothetical protein